MTHDHLSIANVTVALRQLLGDAVAADVPGATATSVSPGGAAASLPDPGVNVYLYRVTPNAAWHDRNPQPRSPDAGTTARRMAVDLEYLLSFYGDDADSTPQRVLGSAIGALQDHPVLADGVQLTQVPLDLDELSRLWSLFSETPYRLSVAYRAAAVLL